jgi:hypothetical protein
MSELILLEIVLQPHAFYLIDSVALLTVYGPYFVIEYCLVGYSTKHTVHA